MNPGDLKPGALLADRYRLERLLGRGGMGVVYLASAEGLNRKVAVKILDLNVESSPEAVERFRREGEAAAAIDHPSVVKAIATGTTEAGMPFLVMDYVEGRTLRDFYKRNGAVPPGVASAIVAPILDALGAAHAAGILHRDLKPANVMLATGPNPQVKLLDFGISKFLRSVTVITRTGATVGTPRYMSPEQMAGERELTPASDLYSAGVMLFELLAGQPPFSAPTDFQLMRDVVMTPAPPIATFKGDLPAQLCRLVDGLLVKNPADRAHSARALRDQLLAAAPAEPDRLWTMAARRTTSGSVPISGGLATPAPIPPSSSLGPTRSLGPAPLPAQKRGWVVPVVGGGVLLGVLGTFAIVLGGAPEPVAPVSALAPVARPVARPPTPAPAPEPQVQPGASGAADAAVELPALPPVDLAAEKLAAKNRLRVALLASADAAIRAGDWTTAQKLLGQCMLGGGKTACPEAWGKLEVVRTERVFKDLLDQAERAIAQKKLPLATTQLKQASGTLVFAERRRDLERRFARVASGSAEVETEAERAEALQHRKELLLANAEAAITAGELPRAEKVFGDCAATSICPEAKEGLDRVRAEKNFKVLLDRADRALAGRNHEQANALLGQTYGTVAFSERRKELEARLQEVVSEAITGPRPAPVPPVKR